LTETTGNSGATPLMAQNIFSYDAAALDFFWRRQRVLHGWTRFFEIKGLENGCWRCDRSLRAGAMSRVQGQDIIELEGCPETDRRLLHWRATRTRTIHVYLVRVACIVWIVALYGSTFVRKYESTFESTPSYESTKVRI
jgi:hypothetical protein